MSSKFTGVIRNIDSLGRICIPKEARRVLNIKAEDPLEIWIEDNAIFLTKHVDPDVDDVISELTELSDELRVNIDLDQVLLGRSEELRRTIENAICLLRR